MNPTKRPQEETEVFDFEDFLRLMGIIAAYVLLAAVLATIVYTHPGLF